MAGAVVIAELERKTGESTEKKLSDFKTLRSRASANELWIFIAKETFF
jgi:hypothetical protein